jgi:cell division septal protein FtsQ
MASSRASTSTGRRRAAKRTPATKASPRKRTAPSHKKPAAKKAPARKPAAKKPAARKAPARKPPAKKASSRARPRSQRPKAGAATPGYGASRALTVAIVAGTVALGLAAAYWFWFKDSSFVAVEKVVVEGIEGPEAAAVTEALTRSGEKMTTLNVDETELAAAVSSYSTVVAIGTETDFPHGLTVTVTGRPPVLTASDGGPPVPVAADGTLLPGVDTAEAGLPEIEVDSMPVKGRLEGEPMALAQVAGAAPEPLRTLIEGLEVNAGDGIEVTLKGGIPVKFGGPDAADEKWAAIAAILANPQVKTLTHLDVRVPERPSIGGAAPAEKT